MVNFFKKSLNYWNAAPCNINYSKKKFLSKEFFLEVKKKNFLLKITLSHSLNSASTRIKKF